MNPSQDSRVRLSVNVNKLATIRNARGKNSPDVLKWSLQILTFGADGITVHPRPDERHIRKQDVYDLKAALPADAELNIEGFPSAEFLLMVKDVRPAQCTLVPDPPHVLTSNAGWKVEANLLLLASTAALLKPLGIRTSVFVDPENCQEKDFASLAAIGIDRVELYTEAFAVAHQSTQASSTGSTHPNQVGTYSSQFREVGELFARAASLAGKAGLGVNAGHDLNLQNLAPLCQIIPQLQEVSIGHQLICDALEFGMEETIRRYLACLGGRK